MKIKKITAGIIFLIIGYLIVSCSQPKYSETEVKNKIEAKVFTNTKWVKPSESKCIKYGGRIEKGVCYAEPRLAKKICKAHNGRLPTIDELKKAMIDCGGVFKLNPPPGGFDVNIKNSSYASCYKQKGFKALSYWSSTRYFSYLKRAWIMNFYDGTTAWESEYDEMPIHCYKIK